MKIKCPICGRDSHRAEDAEDGYCATCKAFTLPWIPPAPRTDRNQERRPCPIEPPQGD
jgi:hypothetical protein